MIPTDISGGLPSPHRLIAGTDWARLEVLVGPEQGCPAVPDLLTTLFQGTPMARARALYDLGEAVNHQNSIVDATAPAMLVVAALLTDPSTDRVQLPAAPSWTDAPPSLRAGLLHLLATVVGDVDNGAEAAGCRFGFELSPVQLQVRAIRPALFPAVHDLLDDPDPAVRQAAALAVIPLLDDPALASHRPALLQRVNTILSSSAGPGRHAFATRAASLPDGPTVPADGGFDDDPPF